VIAQLLARWKGDPAALADLRRLLHNGSQHTSGVARLNDDDILAEVGRLVQAGELLLVEMEPLRLTSSSGGAQAPAAAPPEAALPKPQRSARESEPEPATFGSDLNVAAQAAALQAAAAQGVPFCPT
jgi:hypothetical protein